MVGCYVVCNKIECTARVRNNQIFAE